MPISSIEDLASAFGALVEADGVRWNVETIVPNRLHISRGALGEYAVILEGPRESFGMLPPIAGLEHSSNVISIPANRSFEALRIMSADALVGNRVMAHIAYELARQLETIPLISNEALFSQIQWVLVLLGGQEGILTVERQRGLVGECLLLRRLLVLSRGKNLSVSTVLERWWGHSPSKRDFAAEGIAVEVKTTSQSTRRHFIGAIEQLEPQSENESVYVYSVGIRTDPTANKKLPDFVGDVSAQLLIAHGQPDRPAVDLFESQLIKYGYRPEHAELYRGAPGYMTPHLAPELFRETDLETVRLNSFVSGGLPGMVASVSYELDITAAPMTSSETDQALLELLRASKVTYQ